MHTYKLHVSTSELRRLRAGVTSKGEELKADSGAKTVAAHKSAKVADMARGLTLDDFGGRSDALGG